jgi:hypothetical protein
MDPDSCHGLQTRKEAFFSVISQTFGLGQTNWADKFGGITDFFGQTIRTHFGTVSSLSMFSNNQPIFLQKTKLLYPNSKYLFEVWIRIRAAKNYVFSHHASVVCVFDPRDQIIRFLLPINLVKDNLGRGAFIYYVKGHRSRY